MNIPELRSQIKSYLTPELYTVALLVLVSLISFGLGRLSALEGTESAVRIEYPQDATAASSTPSSSAPARAGTVGAESFAGLPLEQAKPHGGTVVASKNGTKYHLPWCSGAKRITEANKVSFASAIEAEAAGYEPAANCPGL